MFALLLEEQEIPSEHLQLTESQNCQEPCLIVGVILDTA